jgi:excisionase family DNA binding protein
VTGHPSGAEASLDAVADDPGRATGLPFGTTTALLARCAVVQAALTGRLLSLSVSGESSPSETCREDRLLGVTEAAERLGVTKDWLYRQAGSLPFTVRLGSKHLRFRSAGLDAYLRQRAGR